MTYRNVYRIAYAPELVGGEAGSLKFNSEHCMIFYHLSRFAAYHGGTICTSEVHCRSATESVFRVARTDLALHMLKGIGIFDTERFSLYRIRDLCTLQRARSWDPHEKYTLYPAVGTEHLGPADLLRHGPSTLARTTGLNYTTISSWSGRIDVQLVGTLL